MSRRRRQSDNDSLDMLLDTITNTFGGIVFLALLVVIMTGSGQPQRGDTTDISEFREVKALLEEQQRRQSQLERMQTSQEIVASISSSAVSERDTTAARELANKYQRLQAKANELLGQRTKAQNDIRQKQSQKHTLNRQLQTEQQHMQQATQALQKEIASRTVDIELPIEKETNKKQIATVAISGKLYFPDLNFGKPPFKLNTSHFVASAQNDALLILNQGKYDVREDSGIPLSDSKQLSSHFSKIDSSTHYLTLVIFDDTLKDYMNLRKSMRESNLEHELVILKQGEQIAEGSRKDNTKVQN